MDHAVVVVLLLLRARELPNLEDAVVPSGLLLTVATASILGFTGNLGGELSYKHLIGANPRQSPESPMFGSRRSPN